MTAPGLSRRLGPWIVERVAIALMVGGLLALILLVATGWL